MTPAIREATRELNELRRHVAALSIDDDPIRPAMVAHVRRESARRAALLKGETL